MMVVTMQLFHQLRIHLLSLAHFLLLVLHQQSLKKQSGKKSMTMKMNGLSMIKVKLHGFFLMVQH